MGSELGKPIETAVDDLDQKTYVNWTHQKVTDGGRTFSMTN